MTQTLRTGENIDVPNWNSFSNTFTSKFNNKKGSCPKKLWKKFVAIQNNDESDYSKILGLELAIEESYGNIIRGKSPENLSKKNKLTTKILREFCRQQLDIELPEELEKKGTFRVSSEKLSSLARANFIKESKPELIENRSLVDSEIQLENRVKPESGIISDMFGAVDGAFPDDKDKQNKIKNQFLINPNEEPDDKNLLFIDDIVDNLLDTIDKDNIDPKNEIHQEVNDLLADYDTHKNPIVLLGQLLHLTIISQQDAAESYKSQLSY